MSIGIQNVEGPANSEGLGGLSAIGTGISNLPTAAPVQDTQNLADNWLKPDLENPAYITPWGEFNIGPTNWHNNLRGAYDKPVTIQKSVQAPTFLDMASRSNNRAGMVEVNKRGMGGVGDWVTPPSGMSGATYVGQAPMGQGHTFEGMAPRIPVQANIRFKDPNMQRYIEAMSSEVDPGYLPNVRKDMSRPDNNGANVAALGNANVGADKLQAIADKYGVTLDEVQNVYSKYNRVRQDIIDPVGANWQNIKAAPFYKDLEAGIRSYTNTPIGRGNAGNIGTAVDFERLRALNPQANLSPEYFALHGPNDSYGRDPYRLTDAYDYLDNGKTLAQSTPAERAAAQEKYLRHKDLLNNTVAEGGPFDYRREYINAGGTKPKGFNWRQDGMSKNGYNEALDISQNFLQHATNGKKSYRDVGFNDASAARALFAKKKVKKGFLGGALGPLMSLASFIPGPIGMGARVLSAFNSAATGNPLGAIASAIGMMPGVNGTGLNVIGGGMGKAAGAIGGVLGGGKIGNLVGNSLVSGGLGALTGAASGNALQGFVGGAAAPIAGGAIQTTTGLSPGWSSALGSGATGLGMSAYRYSKGKAAQQEALKKQLAMRQNASRRTT